MSGAGGPCRGPSANALEAKRTTCRPVDTAGAVRLDIAVDGWHFAYVVDTNPQSGEVRDIAQTIARVAGCSPDVALGAVLTAIGAPPLLEWEAAA
ncbi:MAG TPA: hypothetical protein VIN65_02905 [Candidatus Dormibacteraeota bacterium]